MDLIQNSLEQILRYPDIYFHQQIPSAVSVYIRQAFATKAQDFPGLCTGIHFYLHFSFQGRDFHRTAQNSIGETDKGIIQQIVSIPYQLSVLQMSGYRRICRKMIKR